MRVYSWDEVGGEISHFEAADDASPVEVYQRSNEVAAYEPTGEYDVWEWVQIGSTSFIAGRWGRDKKFALWWGPAADVLRAIFQLELEHGED